MIFENKFIVVTKMRKFAGRILFLIASLAFVLINAHTVIPLAGAVPNEQRTIPLPPPLYLCLKEQGGKLKIDEVHYDAGMCPPGTDEYAVNDIETLVAAFAAAFQSLEDQVEDLAAIVDTQDARIDELEAQVEDLEAIVDTQDARIDELEAHFSLMFYHRDFPVNIQNPGGVTSTQHRCDPGDVAIAPPFNPDTILTIFPEIIEIDSILPLYETGGPIADELPNGWQVNWLNHGSPGETLLTRVNCADITP